MPIEFKMISAANQMKVWVKNLFHLTDIVFDLSFISNVIVLKNESIFFNKITEVLESWGDYLSNSHQSLELWDSINQVDMDWSEKLFDKSLIAYSACLLLFVDSWGIYHWLL